MTLNWQTLASVLVTALLVAASLCGGGPSCAEHAQAWTASGATDLVRRVAGGMARSLAGLCAAGYSGPVHARSVQPVEQPVGAGLVPLRV